MRFVSFRVSLDGATMPDRHVPIDPIAGAAVQLKQYVCNARRRVSETTLALYISLRHPDAVPPGSRETSGSLRTAGILLFLRPRSSTSWLGLVQPAYQVEAAVTVAWSLLYRKVDAIRCPPKMQHSEAVNHRGAVAGCGARIHPTTHLSISRRNNSNPRGPLSEPGRVHGAMRNSYFLAHGLRSRSRPITQPCQRWPVPA